MGPVLLGPRYLRSLCSSCKSPPSVRWEEGFLPAGLLLEIKDYVISYHSSVSVSVFVSFCCRGVADLTGSVTPVRSAFLSTDVAQKKGAANLPLMCRGHAGYTLKNRQYQIHDQETVYCFLHQDESTCFWKLLFIYTMMKVHVHF